jgi:TonB family protein
MWSESGENLNGMIRRIEWSGPCAANGLANGTGTLAIYSQDLSSQGRKVSTGAVNNGIMNGRFAVEDQSNENGGWQAWSDDAGPRRYDMDYRNGCNFYDGQAEGGCTQSHALAMRDNFLAGFASITPVPQNAPRPAPVPVYRPSLAQSPKVLNDLSVAVSYSYPAEAEKNGLHGTVGIEVWVSTLGRTSKCVVTKSSGHGILDDAACYAMERYGRFTPGTDDNGRQVEKTLRMKIKF